MPAFTPIDESRDASCDILGGFPNVYPELGAFLMPSHPPERAINVGQELDLAELERLDRLGFGEAWVGEHFTCRWEPCPAPDLLIAQALTRTRTIRLGPLGHLLPYHNPVALAHRISYLDHLAGGRCALGVGISALPTDHQLFGIETADGRNRRMTFEALDIMTRLWTDGAQSHVGEFWTMGALTAPVDTLGYHLHPYQRPHPPIAIAALTPGSGNHRLAGEKGYWPVSLSISPDTDMLKRHWDTVSEGAAAAGRKADRREWRIIRDIYVAPSDAEARVLAIEGMMGRCWNEFLLPLYLKLGLGPMLKGGADIPDDAIDLDYLCDHVWIVGSPETVARRIAQLHRAVGGFGMLLAVSYDCQDEAADWERSLSLLRGDVLPRLHALLSQATCGEPT